MGKLRRSLKRGLYPLKSGYRKVILGGRKVGRKLQRLKPRKRRK